MKLSILTIQGLLALFLGVRTFDEDPLGFATVGSTPFCQGATIHGSSTADVVGAQRVGSNCARVRIPWLVVQRDPILRSDFCQTDPPEALRSRCDNPNTGAPGAASVQRACWEKEAKGRLQFVEVDDIIYSVVDPKFHVVAVLGEGTVWSLPVIEDNISNENIGNRPLDPNIDGIHCYLNNLYVYARVVVMRYKAVIKHWQLENALNAAAMHSKYYGWRSRSNGEIDVWSTKVFRDQVLQTLIDAVRDTGDSSLRISTAIDSDVPAAAYQVLQLPADGAMPEEAASEGLRQGLDYVGLLAFPCRFGGAFLGGSDCGSQVGNRVGKLREHVGDEVDIVVMATGASTCRTEQQVSESDVEIEQAAFVQAAYKTATEQQISGFFYVGTASSAEPHMRSLEHTTHPIWSMTDFGMLSKQLHTSSYLAYRVLGSAIERQEWDELADWLRNGGDTSEEGLSVLVSPFGMKDCPGFETDQDWALLRSDSQPREAFTTLTKMYREEEPLSAELLEETKVIGSEVESRY